MTPVAEHWGARLLIHIDGHLALPLNSSPMLDRAVGAAFEGVVGRAAGRDTCGEWMCRRRREAGIA